MEEEEEDARYEFEERDGRRLKFFAGEPGNYVGVTEYKGKRRTSYYARASITKNKGDARRQYHIKPANGGVRLSRRWPRQLPLRMLRLIHSARPRLRANASPAHVCCPPAPLVLICFVSDTPLRLLLHARQPNRCSAGSASPRPTTTRIQGALNFLQS